MAITVTITECYGERREFVTTHQTADKGEAERLAIASAYGRGKFLCLDRGLAQPGGSACYGQIGHCIDRKQGLISTDTARVRIEFEVEN